MACPYKDGWGVIISSIVTSQGDELVGQEVARGRLSDDCIPKHGGDAVAWSLDGQVFLCKDFAFGDVSGGDYAFAGDFDVGAFGVGDLLDATRSKLPDGEELVDARFSLVSRGCAPTWEGLGGRWAARKSYGKDILNLYDKMSSRYAGRNKSKSKADKRPKKAQDEVVPVVEPVMQPEIIIFAEEEGLVAPKSDSPSHVEVDSRSTVLGNLGADTSEMTAVASSQSIESSAEVVRKAFENVSSDEADTSHCQPVFPAVPARLIPYFMEKATIHAPAD